MIELVRILSNNGHEVRISKSDLRLLDGAKLTVSKDNKSESFYAYASWLVDSGGIVQIGLGRLILGLEKGDKLEAEHINPNWTLDYRRSNLRVAIRAQNNANRRMRKDNTSGYKGVTVNLDKRGGYRAQIMVNGEGIALGVFPTKKAAYARYCKAARKYHGEFARPERRRDEPQTATQM